MPTHVLYVLFYLLPPCTVYLQLHELICMYIYVPTHSTGTNLIHDIFEGSKATRVLHVKNIKTHDSESRGQEEAAVRDE